MNKKLVILVLIVISLSLIISGCFLAFVCFVFTYLCEGEDMWCDCKLEDGSYMGDKAVLTSKFLPEKCVMTTAAGFFCHDFYITQTKVLLTVKALKPEIKNIFIDDFVVGNCMASTAKKQEEDKWLLEFSDCDNGAVGEKVSKEITIVIRNLDTGTTSEIDGEVVAIIIDDNTYLEIASINE